MVPKNLSPADWLAAIDGLSRLPALILLCVCASMLVFGSRGFRFYVCFGVLVGGWIGGTVLAGLMRVKGWYVGLPSALILLAPIWPISKWAAPMVIGIACGCGVGTIVAGGFEIDAFWVAFAVGLFVGVSLAVLTARFAIALFTAACGTLGIVASLGAVVRASSGWLAPGGYVQHPVIYVIAGPVLFVIAMVVQVMLEPDAHPGDDEVSMTDE